MLEKRGPPLNFLNAGKILASYLNQLGKELGLSSRSSSVFERREVGTLDLQNEFFSLFSFSCHLSHNRPFFYMILLLVMGSAKAKPQSYSILHPQSAFMTD